ncbi:MAG TPA: DsrH/TusB family sulfur metabolism protein [Thermodesulfovibrionales bacterium]|nr:DsrH/TusB family sulfur metabolism protein [Thermodesulfovibrionales bacterium]
MVVIIKSGPDTPEGTRAAKLARDMSADIVLLQNGVYFMQKSYLEDLGFIGTAFVLSDDRKLRGLSEISSELRMKEITYDDLTDLMTAGDKVLGMF